MDNNNNNYAYDNPRDQLFNQGVQSTHPRIPNVDGDQRQTSTTDSQNPQHLRRQNPESGFSMDDVQQPFRDSQPQDSVWSRDSERGQGQVATDRDLGGQRLAGHEFPKTEQTQERGGNTGYFETSNRPEDLRKQYGMAVGGQSATAPVIQQSPEQQRALFKDYGISQEQQPYDNSSDSTEQQQAPFNEYGSGLQQDQTSQLHQNVGTRGVMPGAFDSGIDTDYRDQSRVQPDQETAAWPGPTYSEPLSATMPSDGGYDERQGDVPVASARNTDARSGLLDRYEQSQFGDNSGVDRSGNVDDSVLQDRDFAQERLDSRSGDAWWDKNAQSGPRVSADEGFGLTSPPPLPPRHHHKVGETTAPVGGYQDVGQEIDRMYDQRTQQPGTLDDSLESGLSNMTLKSDDPNRHASPLSYGQDTSRNNSTGIFNQSGDDTGLTSRNVVNDSTTDSTFADDNTGRYAHTLSQPSLSDRTGVLEESTQSTRSAPATTAYGTGALDTESSYTGNTDTDNIDTNNTQTGITDTNEDKPSYTEGLGKKLKGQIKYGLGKILGDQYLQSEGHQQKQEGNRTLDEHRQFADEKAREHEAQSAATDPASRREE